MSSFIINKIIAIHKIVFVEWRCQAIVWSRTPSNIYDLATLDRKSGSAESPTTIFEKVFKFLTQTRRARENTWKKQFRKKIRFSMDWANIYLVSVAHFIHFLRKTTTKKLKKWQISSKCKYWWWMYLLKLIYEYFVSIIRCNVKPENHFVYHSWCQNRKVM